MSQLPQSVNFNDPLPVTQQIKFASQSSYIKDSDDGTITHILKSSMARAEQMTGYNTSVPDVEFLMSSMLQELKANWKGLRVTEIGIFFDLWAKKHYGDWIGFTFSNIIQYGLRPYFVDPVRLQHIKVIEAPKPLELDYDPGEKRFKELQAEFKEKGTCEDTGNIVYDWMIEKGMIEKGFGNSFYKEAQELLIRKNNTEMIGCINPALAKNIKKTIEALETQHPNTLIIVKAKKLAVIQYFKTEEI